MPDWRTSKNAVRDIDQGINSPTGHGVLGDATLRVLRGPAGRLSRPLHSWGDRRRASPRSIMGCDGVRASPPRVVTRPSVRLENKSSKVRAVASSLCSLAANTSETPESLYHRHTVTPAPLTRVSLCAIHVYIGAFLPAATTLQGPLSHYAILG